MQLPMSATFHYKLCFFCEVYEKVVRIFPAGDFGKKEQAVFYDGLPF